MTMFNFKGIRMYIYIAEMLLVFQLLKLIHFAHSMEVVAFVAFFITIVSTFKLIIFDNKLRNAKYWLLLIIMLLQEVILGLDKLLPVTYYNTIVPIMLCISVWGLICLDAPSIRRHMDEDAYVLKNAYSMITLTYVLSVIEILMGYVYQSYSPM